MEDISSVDEQDAGITEYYPTHGKEGSMTGAGSFSRPDKAHGSRTPWWIDQEDAPAEKSSSVYSASDREKPRQPEVKR